MAETYSRPIRVPRLSWVLKKPAIFNELRSQATCDEREKTGGGTRPGGSPPEASLNPCLPAGRQSPPHVRGVVSERGKKSKKQFFKKDIFGSRCSQYPL